MNLAAIVLSTVFFAGLTYFFYRKCQSALDANCEITFTKWLRLRHGSFLLLWILTGIYLYIEPDSKGVMLAVWWSVLGLAIIIEGVQFVRTFSPKAMAVLFQKQLGTDQPASAA